MNGYFAAAYIVGAAVTTWAYMEKSKPGNAISDLILSVGVATWPLTWAWAVCMLAAESRNKRRDRRRP